MNVISDHPSDLSVHELRERLVATGRQPATRAPALMTATGLEEVRRELEQLRDRVERQIAQQLSEARSYGGGSNNDEYHAVLEEQMVLSARIALLEEIVGRAVVIDPDEAGEGVAAIGTTVLIEDLGSKEKRRYRLAGAHAPGADVVSAASPMGQALMGASPGDAVTLDLPNGSSKSVRLVAVEASPAGGGDQHG